MMNTLLYCKCNNLGSPICTQQSCVNCCLCDKCPKHSNEIKNNISIISTLTFSYLTKYDSVKLHTDIDSDNSKKMYAGVLYLNKNIKPEYGTIVGNTKIEAKYNRLVLYDGSVLHSPTKGFGTNKFNSRMTLNVFYEFF